MVRVTFRDPGEFVDDGDQGVYRPGRVDLQGGFDMPTVLIVEWGDPFERSGAVETAFLETLRILDIYRCDWAFP